MNWYFFSSPSTFYRPAGKLAPWFFALAAVLAAAGLYIGFVIAPVDAVQGEVYRIIFLHVPAAWMSMFLYCVLACWGAVSLIFNPRLSAMMARAIAPTGALFTFIALWSGAFWGKPTWGTYWVWDARLTTTAFLFVTYVGYLAVRRLGGSHDARARRSAVLALLAVLEIPLVHFSVVLWRPLHQEASVANPTGDVEMDGLMLFSLFVGIIAFTLLHVWLLLHQQRVLAMEDAIDDRGLDLALAERVKEGM
jgi:heme exporter protein C